MDIAEWVKAERERRGWTQQELADRAGVDRVEINAVERGRNKVTSARMREALARAFGLHPSQLGGGPRPRSDPPFATEQPRLGNSPSWLAAEAAYRAKYPDKYPERAYDLARAASFSSLPDPITEDFVADIVMVLWKHHRG